MFFYSCNQQEENVSQPIDVAKENFTLKTMEIIEELGNYFPPEDVICTIGKDENGEMFAFYKVIGKTKEEIDWGSFIQVESNRNDEGTTCDGKWSCGKAIYARLGIGYGATIKKGGCGDNGNPDHYCVTCIPE